MPCTTIACSAPSAASASAIGRSSRGSATPSNWRAGARDSTSGAIRLKSVRIAERSAQHREARQRGMISRREDEAACPLERGSVRAPPDRDRSSRRIAPARRRRRPSADRAITMLGDRHAGRRRDQRGAGRNVEGAGAVAAGARGIEHVAIDSRLSGRARLRIARAPPASSAAVSPFILSATRKPATSASGTMSSRTSPITPSASRCVERAVP